VNPKQREIYIQKGKKYINKYPPRNVVVSSGKTVTLKANKEIMIKNGFSVESGGTFEMDVEPYVIVTAGNIINAEDMFETWDDLNVKVVRYGRGKPSDLPNFQQLVVETKDRLSRDDLMAFKKLMKKLI
jgi:peptide subunit release factor 1 (eRF1)